MSSGVGEHLQYTRPERSLQITVDVQSERFEPRESCLLYGAPGQLEVIGQGWGKLAVGGQGYLVDVGLRAR